MPIPNPHIDGLITSTALILVTPTPIRLQCSVVHDTIGTGVRNWTWPACSGHGYKGTLQRAAPVQASSEEHFRKTREGKKRKFR